MNYPSNLTNSTLPESKMIRGGIYHGNREKISGTTVYPLYTCRARRQGQLLLGRLGLNYLKSKPTCYTTFSKPFLIYFLTMCYIYLFANNGNLF